MIEFPTERRVEPQRDPGAGSYAGLEQLLGWLVISPAVRQAFQRNPLQAALEAVERGQIEALAAGACQLLREYHPRDKRELALLLEVTPAVSHRRAHRDLYAA